MENEQFSALLKESICRQFLASLDALKSAITNCPQEFWTECIWSDQELPSDFPSFWAISHHTLFWADLYLTGAVEGYTTPVPFGLDELDPAGLLPPRIYE